MVIVLCSTTQKNYAKLLFESSINPNLHLYTPGQNVHLRNNPMLTIYFIRQSKITKSVRNSC